MKILLSNDDGYDAEGLVCLKNAMRKIGEVVVVAPITNCSGKSSALSLKQPIRVERLEDNLYAVDGTPADCVHLAVNGMLDFEADVVVSGINNGENMGDDPVYSGTVAAALEGRFLQLPCVAISLQGPHLQYYETAAKIACEVVLALKKNPNCGAMLLNINVPDLPYDQITGYEVTRCGSRTQSYPVIVKGKSETVNYYEIGPPGKATNLDSGSDFYAVSNGRVSITPITNDMTDHDKIATLSHWLETLTAA